MQTSQLDSCGIDVGQMVSDIFQTMLDLSIESASDVWSADLDLVTAVVHFAGAWKGAVLLECTPDQAFDYTAKMTGVPKPSTMDDDVRDALGELANVVAGNLKSVLKPGVSLSMPSVVEGSRFTVHICGGNIVSRLVFTDGVGPFWVALVEMMDGSENEAGN